MMCARPAPARRSRLPRGRVRVFNETDRPATVAVPGRPAATVTVAPGDEVTLSVPRTPNAALIVACADQRRTYALDLDLLGFDTVHLRPADLARR